MFLFDAYTNKLIHFSVHHKDFYTLKSLFLIRYVYLAYSVIHISIYSP